MTSAFFSKFLNVSFKKATTSSAMRCLQLCLGLDGPILWEKKTAYCIAASQTKLDNYKVPFSLLKFSD